MFKELDLPKIVAELPHDIKNVYLELCSDELYGNFCVLTGSRMLKEYGLLNRKPSDYDICIISDNSDFVDDPGVVCEEFDDLTNRVAKELRKRGFEIVKWYSLEQDAENDYDDFSFICKAKKDDIILDVLFRVEDQGCYYEDFMEFSKGVFNGKNIIDGVFGFGDLSGRGKYRYLNQKGKHWAENCFIFDSPQNIIEEKMRFEDTKHRDDIYFITDKLKDKVDHSSVETDHSRRNMVLGAITECYNSKY